MSKEAITKVVQRAISDAGFRRQLSTDPTGALRGFDLSADETAALRTGDAGRLSALGVDQRMSKAFALGGAAVGATRTAGSDLSNASSAMASDASAAAANARGNALVSSNLAESDALISDGSAGRTIIPTEPHLRNADADGAVGAAGNAISDDPDGFLRAADARGDEGGASGGVTRINDDPDGFLAAADARGSGGSAGETTAYSDNSEEYLTKVGYDSSAARAVVTDAHDRGDRAAVSDTTAGSGSSGETAFLDDSEAYLSPIGVDPTASSSAVTDAHDRGDHMADPTSIADDDAAGGSGASEGGPNISH